MQALDLSNRTILEEYRAAISKVLEQCRSKQGEIAALEKRIEDRAAQIQRQEAEGDIGDAKAFSKLDEGHRHLAALSERVELLRSQIAPLLNKMAGSLRWANDAIEKALRPGYDVLICRIADAIEQFCENRARAIQIAQYNFPCVQNYAAFLQPHFGAYGTATFGDGERALELLDSILAENNPFTFKGVPMFKAEFKSAEEMAAAATVYAEEHRISPEEALNIIGAH